MMFNIYLLIERTNLANPSGMQSALASTINQADAKEIDVQNVALIHEVAAQLEGAATHVVSADNPEHYAVE